MGMIRLDTADISIEGGNAMDQPQPQEKVEGTVHRRRCGAALLLQGAQDLVGADRFVLLPDQFENPPPNSGQAFSLSTADLLGCCQCFGQTALMIMVVADKMQLLRIVHASLSELWADHFPLLCRSCNRATPSSI